MLIGGLEAGKEGLQRGLAIGMYSKVTAFAQRWSNSVAIKTLLLGK